MFFIAQKQKHPVGANAPAGCFFAHFLPTFTPFSVLETKNEFFLHFLRKKSPFFHFWYCQITKNRV
jgi:hypothetical protein